MADEDKAHLSVLLPAASVALFSDDDATKEAFMALENDWRFARVVLKTMPGDVVAATSHYASNTAPDLIIVQEENIGDDFTGKLEGLAERLSENTSAVVIGPVNDVSLYRKLVDMGVSDYLVKPVPTKDFGDVIAATLIEQIGLANSSVIALMGAKGGVGVTALTEALSWYISEELKQKTFLMDAAGGWSTLSVGMDFEPSTTLAEAVRAASEGNEDSLTRMIYNATEKLSVLSSGGDVMLDDSADAGKYETLLEYVMGIYPVVLVDLSGSSAAMKRGVLKKAHKTLLVTTPLLPSVRATRTLLQEMKEIRGGSIDDVEIVVNMQNYAPKSEVPKAQINEALAKPAAAIIDFDAELFVSTESEAAKLNTVKGGAEVVNSLLKPLSGLLSITVSDSAGDDDKKAGIGNLLTKLKGKG